MSHPSIPGDTLSSLDVSKAGWSLREAAAAKPEATSVAMPEVAMTKREVTPVKIPRKGVPGNLINPGNERETFFSVSGSFMLPAEKIVAYEFKEERVPVLSIDLNDVPQALREDTRAVVDTIVDDAKAGIRKRIDAVLLSKSRDDEAAAEKAEHEARLPKERWKDDRRDGELAHEFALRIWGDGQNFHYWVHTGDMYKDIGLKKALAAQEALPEGFEVPTKGDAVKRRNEHYLATGGKGMSWLDIVRSRSSLSKQKKGNQVG